MSPMPPGCYYKQASASQKCGGPFLEWERDVWGEANADSGTSEENCLARKAGHDAYCGVTTEWRSVGAPPTPATAPAPTAAPKPTPTPTAEPPGDSLSLSFEPYSCKWKHDLHSMAGATFEGATIR